MTQYQVVLPEEKREKKWKIFVIFFISLLLHVGILALFRGEIIGALAEARLREVQLLEEQLAKKKHVNPKAKKALEKKKKELKEEKKDEKKGDNKPPGKLSLAPKLSTSMPSPNIKIGGPKLPDVKLPEDVKLQIAQTQILPEQMEVQNIDLSQLAELQNMQADIDVEAMDLSLDAEVADVAVVVTGGGASISDILSQEAVPAVSLGGPGIEGSLGGGLGFGEGFGGGGGIGAGGGGIDLESSGGALPGTEIKIAPAASAASAAASALEAGPAQVKAGSPMELRGEVKNRKILKKVRPVYPARARREGWSGVVVLSFSVDPAGNVKDVRVARSSGYPELDRAAKNALRQWKFAPKDIDHDESGQLIVRFELM